MAALTVSVALSSGCGGTDGMTSCPGGATTYALDGTYTTNTASNLVDGCGEGLMPMNLEGARMIQHDEASGVVTISSAQGAVLAAGPVNCNKGKLTFGPSTLANVSCSWTSSRTVEFEATGDYRVTIQVTDDRSDTKQAMGGAPCMMPASCTTRFTLTLAR